MNQDRGIKSLSQQHERWVKFILGVGLLLLLAWLYFSSPRSSISARRPSDNATTTTTSPEARSAEVKSTASESPGTAERRASDVRKPASQSIPTQPAADEQPLEPLVIHNARVVDEDGRVIHRGDVDLRPTIERIERGKRLRFSHDGSVFENRERRLPIKPSAYYREFIYPTPDDDGPGAQRVVVGREGEVYYTPDHYKTFRRIR